MFNIIKLKVLCEKIEYSYKETKLLCANSFYIFIKRLKKREYDIL